MLPEESGSSSRSSIQASSNREKLPQLPRPISQAEVQMVGTGISWFMKTNTIWWQPGTQFLYYKFSIEHWTDLIPWLMFWSLNIWCRHWFLCFALIEPLMIFTSTLNFCFKHGDGQGNLKMIKWVNRRTFEQVDDGLHNRPLCPVLVVRRVENRAGDSFVMIALLKSQFQQFDILLAPKACWCDFQKPPSVV